MGFSKPRLGVVMALDGKLASADASLVAAGAAAAGGVSLLVAVDENKEKGMVYYCSGMERS